jgi:hypothetical protein
MRFALLLSSVAFAACTVGEIDDTGSGSSTGPDPAACVDRLATPDALTTHSAPVVAGNPSNAGQNCIQSSCHLNSALGAGAPGFQFAGTVFKMGTTTPDAGAVVKVVVNGMVVAQKYTDQGGNFYVPAGTLMGAFTASTSVSACPKVMKMVGTISGGDPGAGACNSCHTTAAGAMAVPIYVQ